ncbi:MAG TPA: FKBP-type peptidyl-prolyl cis-trans isomerase [Acidimicrobiales bacterium]|nr:FKBP-type peptidyl-prolyl cis-trans isomerase [Acidimicrobiales bacterium]
MPAPKALLLAGVLTALALSGCGSSKSPSGAATSTTVPSATTSPSGSSSPSSGSAPGGTSTDSTLFAAGPVPAVTGATDLQKQPTVAAGSGAPPAKLTGKDLVTGNGATAGPDATVTVQYVGALWSSGKVFDASWTDQGPATFQLSGVIPGFKDAIIGMKVGGRREIVIPPALGYGSSGQGPIPPNATLVFVIDLIQVQQ